MLSITVSACRSQRGVGCTQVEPALRDPAFLRTDLPTFAEEWHARFLVRLHRHRDTRTRRPARRLDAGDAPRVVETCRVRSWCRTRRAGGEAIVALREQEVSGRERLVLFAEHHHVVGVDLAVGAFDLDVADGARSSSRWYSRRSALTVRVPVPRQQALPARAPRARVARALHRGRCRRR